MSNDVTLGSPKSKTIACTKFQSAFQRIPFLVLIPASISSLVRSLTSRPYSISWGRHALSSMRLIPVFSAFEPVAAGEQYLPFHGIKFFGKLSNACLMVPLRFFHPSFNPFQAPAKRSPSSSNLFLVSHNAFFTPFLMALVSCETIPPRIPKPTEVKKSFHCPCNAIPASCIDETTDATLL